MLGSFNQNKQKNNNENKCTNSYSKVERISFSFNMQKNSRFFRVRERV